MSDAPSEELEVRAAKNQALFRDINERLLELAADADEQGAWNCECADVTCLEQIQMTHAEYEAMRSDSTRFAFAADERHVLPEVERVVERNDRHWIVEKVGEAGETAETLDPR